MDNFSWTDSFQACLPCLRPRVQLLDSDDEQQQGRRSHRIASADLQRLLADGDSDVDAETLSLHSNVGRRRTRKSKKAKKAKGIAFWGYDLFGRRQPAIHLPPDDEEEERVTRSRVHADAPGMAPTERLPLTSSMPDAAPLDPEAIERLSVIASPPPALSSLETPETAEEIQARLKQEKAERRAQRRERRELKRVAAALAAGTTVDFEGFQGSGADAHYGAVPSPFNRGAYPVSPSQTDSYSSEPTHYSSHAPSPGPDDFVHVDGAAARDAEAEEADGDADFGGATYTRKRMGGSSSGGRTSSGSRSDTLSSANHVSPHAMTFHPAYQAYYAQVQVQDHPAQYAHDPAYQALYAELDPAQRHKVTHLDAPRRKIKKKGSTKSNLARSETSDPAPRSPLSLDGFVAAQQAKAESQSPAEFEGFPLGDDEFGPSHPPGFPSSGLAKEERGPFPSAGIGSRPMARQNSDMGVFLARRGDD